MSIQLSTAGVTINYGVETTAGTRPTLASAYTKIPEIKSIPDLNPPPEQLETTTLEALQYRTYIAGLKDLGGAMSLTMNLTQDSMDAWETLVTAYETAKASNKAMWFCVIVPGLTDSLFFTGEPSALGLSAIEVNSVLETTVYVTPTNEPAWLTKPST